MRRKRARFIRPAPWHDEFLAWLAAGLGPKAAALEVSRHPTRAMQVRWTDEAFMERWLAINEMKEREHWREVEERLAVIRARAVTKPDRRRSVKAGENPDERL